MDALHSRPLIVGTALGIGMLVLACGGAPPTEPPTGGNSFRTQIFEALMLGGSEAGQFEMSGQRVAADWVADDAGATGTIKNFTRTSDAQGVANFGPDARLPAFGISELYSGPAMER